MKLVDVKIDSQATTGGKTALTDVQPVYDYADGVRTNNVVAYRYTVALIERGYEKLAVKIMGAQLLDAPEDGNYPLVQFSGLEIYVYWTSGGYQVGARATGVSVVTAAKH